MPPVAKGASTYAMILANPFEILVTYIKYSITNASLSERERKTSFSRRSSFYHSRLRAELAGQE